MSERLLQVSIHLLIVAHQGLGETLMDRRMSSQNRKQCILEAVRGVFCKKGIRATSKELSEAAGVSEALIYKHFDSKEGLYQAMLQECCTAHEDIGHELTQLEPSTEVLTISVYLLICAIIKGIKKEGDSLGLTPEELHGLLLQSFQTDGDMARTLFESGLGPWVPYFVKSMQAATKNGDRVEQKTHPEDLIWLAHHFILGVAMTRLPHPSAFMPKKLSEEKLLNSMHMFFLRGLGLKQQAIEKSLQSNNFKSFKKKINP